MAAAALREAGVDPIRLQLEVTEGVLPDPAPETLRTLDALHRLGVKLAIVDFGVGHSPMVSIERVRLLTLKIDRAFVKDLGSAALQGDLSGRPELHTRVVQRLGGEAPPSDLQSSSEGSRSGNSTLV